MKARELVSKPDTSAIAAFAGNHALGVAHRLLMQAMIVKGVTTIHTFDDPDVFRLGQL